ncbi:hypothetical protein O181_011804 [Austropuccinia psidii MF-1]|uniref:Uncharacterized protein n=1 Tax=Austropuccinia psidii MF-1 TaxID=1389203 RepID=A0A9Q3GM79_9BASI|nr:hypothetical protein [Austropuccinia psidii MF-1]
MPASNVRRYLWSKKNGHFGKELPVSEDPTPDGTSGYSNYKPIYSSSEVPISTVNTEGVVKRIRKIANSPTNPNAEGSDELDGEEVEVVLNSSGNQSSTSPSQPSAKRFQSQVIPSTPRNLQPLLSTIPSSIPPPSPIPSTARPSWVSTVRPSPIPHPRDFPMITSQQLQAVANSSRRRDNRSPFPFPATQVFQKRENWPIRLTREDPNMKNEGQDAVARLFGRVDRNIREVIMYDNDRKITANSSEEMASKFAWYEDEFIHYFQRTFDDLGRDN